MIFLKQLLKDLSFNWKAKGKKIGNQKERRDVDKRLIGKISMFPSSRGLGLFAVKCVEKCKATQIFGILRVTSRVQ
jgi:hypothetical protein